jgi:EAL domain-containing protein (putative c-di-GMP-specific phosphodiesterase class I)
MPADGTDCSTLIRNAAAAKYRARNYGGGDFQFYAPEMSDLAVERLALETRLCRALENDEFVVFYQPKINLNTSEVVGVEALVRWQHPGRGLLLPGEFISVAEETGLIVPLGAWVLRTACAQVRAWQLDGLTKLRLAVNVSPRQFQQKNLLSSVMEALEETGLSAADLELELTESSIMRNAKLAAEILHELKDRGVKIAVDDFGTGHSSLGYLRSLPLDVLKVDRSFVHNATTNADDAALVMAIITLAHSLRLAVIAEGVETAEHLQFLKLLRCDEAQGYLFAQAMPADQFRMWLKESSREKVALPARQ